MIVRIDVTTRPRASRPFASCPTRAGIRVVAGNRERPNTQRVRGFPILVHALRMRTRAAGLEVPVLVFGVDGLADHIRGARTREEVVVLLTYLVSGVEWRSPAQTHHVRSREICVIVGRVWAG